MPSDSLSRHSAANRAEPIPLERPLELAEIPTPALVIDRVALDSNLERMAAHLERAGVGARPHAKTHKCPIIARRQMELGAVGICCAKVSEAEVMVAAGLGQILVTSPVVTRDKAGRVAQLAAAGADVAIVVDAAAPARLLSAAASAAGVEVGVLIDLDVGTRRTGVAPGEPALRLLREIADLPGLRFEGLQAYAGHLMHVEGHAVRAERSRKSLAAAVATKEAMHAAGFEVRVLTGGGTGTFDIDSEIDGMTDLQVGSYVFMDAEYRTIGDRRGAVFATFEPALFVLATAISQPVEGLITVDAGFKAMAAEATTPVPIDLPQVSYHFAGDEHGVLKLSPGSRIALGDQVKLLVSHCDPTVNLYDVYHVARDGQVEELWPIAARGCSQ